MGHQRLSGCDGAPHLGAAIFGSVLVFVGLGGVRLRSFRACGFRIRLTNFGAAFISGFEGL